MTATTKELFVAVAESDLQKVIHLLGEGASVNEKDSNGETPLVIACKKANNHALIITLLEAGADINDAETLTKLTKLKIPTKTLKLFLDYGVKPATGKGQSFISLVDKTQNESSLITLLKAGFSYSEIGSAGWTPLMYAAHLQHKRKAFLLIVSLAKNDGNPKWEMLDTKELKSHLTNSGEFIRYVASFEEDVNSADEIGNTALHLASAIPDSEVAVSALLSLGADLKIRNLKGFTPLFKAAITKHGISAATLLLDNGAKVDEKDILGRTPLFLALKSGNDADMTALLLSRGADPNSINNWGQTPLMMANGVLEAELLLNSGADPNAVGEPMIGGGSVLNHLIASKADSKTVSLLLCRGADPDFTPPDMPSPLCQAISTYSLSTVRLLVSHKANINSIGPDGLSALEMAIRGNFDTAAALLISKGAALGPLNDKCWTPLMHVIAFAQRNEILFSVAKRRKDEDKAWLLLFRMLSVTNPGESTKLAIALIKQGVSVNAVTKDGQNALFFLSESEFDVPLLEKLLEQDIDVNRKDRNGITPLMKLSSLKNEAYLARLLQRGAKANDEDNLGNTPLHYAAASSHVKNLSLLIRYDAAINARNKEGATPLMTAALSDSQAMIKALIAAGANAEAKNNNGDTALLLAIKEGKNESVKALLNEQASVLLRDANDENVISLAKKSTLKENTKNRLKESYNYEKTVR